MAKNTSGPDNPQRTLAAAYSVLFVLKKYLRSTIILVGRGPSPRKWGNDSGDERDCERLPLFGKCRGFPEDYHALRETSTALLSWSVVFQAEQ